MIKTMLISALAFSPAVYGEPSDDIYSADVIVIDTALLNSAILTGPAVVEECQLFNNGVDSLISVGVDYSTAVDSVVHIRLGVLVEMTAGENMVFTPAALEQLVEAIRSC